MYGMFAQRQVPSLGECALAKTSTGECKGEVPKGPERLPCRASLPSGRVKRAQVADLRESLKRSKLLVLECIRVLFFIPRVDQFGTSVAGTKMSWTTYATQISAALWSLQNVPTRH